MIHREVPLSPVQSSSSVSTLDALLSQRRSTRSFDPRPLSLKQVTAVAWAAQGRTPDQRRVCPSAHALYPLTLTLIAGDVEGLSAGAYTYDAGRHVLISVGDGDYRGMVARTTFVDGDWLQRAAALLLLSGNLSAADEHFADQPPRGRRGERYVWLEAGHASQNIYLRATEDGFGAVLVAGFDDDRLLGLMPAIVPPGHHPLALLGIGHPTDPR